MAEERLQKVLASAGVASRRASEGLIAAGRVLVDGKRAALGDRVDPATAKIEVDGIPVGLSSARAYLALHKPAGVTSTTQDRHAAMTVLQLLPTALVPDGSRLYPVGRLDQDSEGLLLLTNDGDWAERVLHPRFGVEREYAVAIAMPLTAEQAQALGAGIRLEEGLAGLAAPLRAATAVETRRLSELLDPVPDPRLTWYRATLAQGWKRQLRRMFAAVGAPVERLVRVRIGSLRIDGLATARSRRLKAPEIRSLGQGRIEERRDPAPGKTAGSPAARPPAGPARPRKPGGPGTPSATSRRADSGRSPGGPATGSRGRGGPGSAARGRPGRGPGGRAPGAGPARGDRPSRGPRGGYPPSR